MTAAKLRTLRQELTVARDDQIARVVAMVDAMPERGEADQLIAPLRGRLTRLRVDRRLGFTRLLFTPLDPVLMAPAAWRRDRPGLPRSTLPALGRLVQQRLGATAREVEAALVGLTARQTGAALAAGRLLWGAAAEVLAGADAPADWTAQTGLQRGDFTALARPCAAVLRHAAPLHAMLARVALGEEADMALLGAMLREAAAAGQAEFAQLSAVLLARLPGCAPLLRLTDELAASGPARVAADEAVRFVLDRMTVAPDIPLARATAKLCGDAALLQRLEECAEQRPTRRAQVSEARQRLDGACRARFAAELPERLLVPARGLDSASDGDMAALEAAARDLRHFSRVAGTLGHAEHYENALRSAAEALRPRPEERPETLADRVRLTEILAGPEVALALLD